MKSASNMKEEYFYVNVVLYNNTKTGCLVDTQCWGEQCLGVTCTCGCWAFHGWSSQILTPVFPELQNHCFFLPKIVL